MPSQSLSKPTSSGSWILGIFLVGVIAMIIFPVHVGGGPSKSSTCASHLKNLAVGHLIYASDYDERFPDRDQWMDALGPYTKNPDLYRCPELEDPKPGEYGYCFNASLSGAVVPKDAAQTPLVFDSINLSRNASGNLLSLPNPGRHPVQRSRDRVNFIAFADGHTGRG